MTEATQRIACEQIDRAIADAADEDFEKAVHQVRKRCKKLRGLLRLVRPSFADYKPENADFRDTARLLARTRDAEVMLGTFEKLIEAGDIDDAALGRVHDRLRNNRGQAVAANEAVKARLAEAVGRLRTARQRVDKWKIEGDGFEALRGGLEKTYARARRCMNKAEKKPSAENLHEWRKRAKYHWYHLRLLRSIWRKPMGRLCNEASQLSDLLGDDHDLAVLSGELATHDAAEQLGGLLELLDKRRAKLQRKAFQLGQRLFAESAGRYTDRMEAYWHAWRRN